MRQQFRTLRFKLAALNLGVFGVIFGVLSVVILTARENQVLREFDGRLIDSARKMSETVRISPQQKPTGKKPKQEPLLSYRFPGYFFQIRDDKGETLERSKNLGPYDLPLSEDARISSRSEQKPVLEIHEGSLADALIGSEGSIRLLTLHCLDSADVPFYLQFGLNLAPVKNSIAEMRHQLYALAPVGLLAVGLASWLMARRSLAPIGRIARQAKAYTAAHLDRRISVPAGQDEVAEMAATINQMLDRLEAAFRAQERFVADASHELKTPISVLLGEAQVLRRQSRSGEAYARFVKSVQDEMRQMAALVDSLLTLARADAGFPLPATMAVSLNEVVVDAVQRCQALAAERRVRLVPVLSMPQGDQEDPQVEGDPALLRMMVENLVRNAIRYSPARETVEVKVALNGGDALVSVADKGPGIPPEHREQVFRRFYRIPGPNAAEGGTGLGLAIAKGVVDLHNGSIGAGDRSGWGCVVTARLPLVRSV